MPVYYDSHKITPAPFISIRKDYQTTDDGAPVGSTFAIQVAGKIIPNKGSPNSSGVFWDVAGYPPDETLNDTQMMAAIIRKQEALRKLFANEGRSFEVQPWDGSPSIKCNPRIKGIEFTADSPISWYNKCNYVINLEADIVYIAGTAVGEDGGDVVNYKISKASEEWNMEPADEFGRTFRLTHTIAANGKRFYDETGTLVQKAWENAKDYVINKITLGLKSDRMVCPGVLDATNLQAFNYVRTEHLNELGGSFQVTETWLCYDPNGEAAAVEDFTITARTSEDGKTQATIEGQIKGLEIRNTSTYALTSTRYTNASLKWNNSVNPSLLSRCQTYTGVTLNPSALNTSVGYNVNNGIINYSYTFDNRPTNLVPGAISETITVVDESPTDVFASLPVLGRASGPVLQVIGTVTSAKRTIQIEAQLKAKTQTFTPTEPNTDSIILANLPAATIRFVSQNTRSWSENSGRYSRTTSYTYE